MYIDKHLSVKKKKKLNHELSEVASFFFFMVTKSVLLFLCFYKFQTKCDFTQIVKKDVKVFKFLAPKYEAWFKKNKQKPVL